jgi:hypothetical protein
MFGQQTIQNNEMPLSKQVQPHRLLRFDERVWWHTCCVLPARMRKEQRAAQGAYPAACSAQPLLLKPRKTSTSTGTTDPYVTVTVATVSLDSTGNGTTGTSSLVLVLVVLAGASTS